MTHPPDRLFLDHLPWIDGALASLSRRHGLDPDEADDFASWSKLKLIDDDYAVLRKFRGESSITTYLAVVLAMHLREYRVQRWGRWRPSAAARRHGVTGVRLETLLHRDGFRLEQAAEILRARDGLEITVHELAQLAAQLPTTPRGRPQPVDLSRAAGLSAASTADAELERAEAGAEFQRVDADVARLLADFPPEDRLILRMRYWDDVSVADISRALSLPQKPLYRRIERLLVRLRRALEAKGITARDVRERIGTAP